MNVTVGHPLVADPRTPDFAGSGAAQCPPNVNWTEVKGRYRARARLASEPGGGYSARVVELPGVNSEGRTKAEAIENTREALIGCLEAYAAAGDPVPWAANPEPVEENDHWIVVDV